MATKKSIKPTAKKPAAKKTARTLTKVIKTLPKERQEKINTRAKTLVKDIAKAKTPVPKLKVKGITPKELANKKGEPWVEIVSVELDPTNVGNGAFELDWNETFLAKLMKAGYQGKTDADIVDNWFKTICRNVLSEEYEQWEANQPSEERLRVVERRPTGRGKTAVS